MILTPNSHNLLLAANHLKAGNVVAIPTETVYGLAADAMNPSAVKKIYELKQRPSHNPLIVHLASFGDIATWARKIPDSAKRLAEKFWPGPLTLVLPKQRHVPSIVTGGQDTVALRVPSHPITQQLLAYFGGGLAAPSANPYTRLSPTTAHHVASYFDESLWIVDGGPTIVGIESTIVACLDNGITILRSGMLSAEQIIDTAQCPVLKNSTKIQSPGQAALHYAPRKPLALFSISNLSNFLAQYSEKPIGLIHYSDMNPLPNRWQHLQLPPSPEGYAQRLYAALHHFDQSSCELIMLELPPREPEYEAIFDRIQRAVGKT